MPMKTFIFTITALLFVLYLFYIQKGLDGSIFQRTIRLDSILSSGRYDQNYYQTLSSSRNILLVYGLLLFRSLPLINKIFGLGPVEYTRVTDFHLHNSFLESTLEGGLILLFILIVIMLIAIN